MKRALLALALIAVVVLLVVWRRDGADDVATPVAPPPRIATPTARPTQPTAPAPAEEARPVPVPVDPSAHPPSLDAPHTPAAPPQTPFTREETIAKREADLALLDKTTEHLNAELATTHDAIAAHDLEVRIARVAALRKQRVGELEQIRAGGALPK